MSDLISRQAAIDVIEDYPHGNVWNVESMEEMVDKIKALPPAQPERKTATWLIHKWGEDVKCSNCGKMFKDVYDMENYDGFCRHCGTKMEGIKVTKK